MEKLSIPKGTRDFGPTESFRRKYIIERIQDQFTIYGFSPIETPSMENLSTLMGKYGDEGDQLLFKVLNSGDFLKKTSEEDFRSGTRSMMMKIAEKGLRYDLTVPFARYVVMNQHNITFPFKRYQIQPVWRADRPQKGRYREFFQCDADIIGTRSSWNEVELTLLIHDVFKSLGLSDFVLNVNHRGVLFAMAQAAGMEGKEIPFCVALDKLDKIGRDKVLEEISKQGGDQDVIGQYLDIIDTKADLEQQIDQLVSVTKSDSPGFGELRKYFESLDAFNNRDFKVELDFSLARGLSYYTGMIYEVKPTTVKMGSICGGGRYDDLTGIFGMKDVSGIGISFGLDRIYDVLAELNLFPQTATGGPKILITHLGQHAFNHAVQLLDKLRLSKIHGDIYPDQSKLKKQLNYANKLNIPFVLTIGDEEIKKEIYPLKNMSSGEVSTLNIEDLISAMT